MLWVEVSFRPKYSFAKRLELMCTRKMAKNKPLIEHFSICKLQMFPKLRNKEGPDLDRGFRFNMSKLNYKWICCGWIYRCHYSWFVLLKCSIEFLPSFGLFHYFRYNSPLLFVRRRYRRFESIDFCIIMKGINKFCILSNFVLKIIKPLSFAGIFEMHRGVRRHTHFNCGDLVVPK